VGAQNRDQTTRKVTPARHRRTWAIGRLLIRYPILPQTCFFYQKLTSGSRRASFAACAIIFFLRIGAVTTVTAAVPRKGAVARDCAGRRYFNPSAP